MARILLADDDPELREVLRAWLSIRYDVTVVGDGEAVLAEVERERPDILVCDMVMPRLGGMDVVERIKANPETADLPICMITASTKGSDTYDYVWQMAADTDGFITKPFEPQELMAKIDRILQKVVAKRRAQREADGH